MVIDLPSTFIFLFVLGVTNLPVSDFYSVMLYYGVRVTVSWSHTCFVTSWCLFLTNQDGPFRPPYTHDSEFSIHTQEISYSFKRFLFHPVMTLTGIYYKTSPNWNGTSVTSCEGLKWVTSSPGYRYKVFLWESLSHLIPKLPRLSSFLPTVPFLMTLSDSYFPTSDLILPQLSTFLPLPTYAGPSQLMTLQTILKSQFYSGS